MKCRTGAGWRAAAVMALALSAAEGFAASALAPVPADAELAKAKERRAEVFKEPIAKAKSADERDALAEQYLEAGVNERQDRAYSFALLTAARETAATAGDLDLALTAIAALAARFDLDRLALKADAAVAVAGVLKDPALRAAFIERAQPLLDEAIRVEKFTAAARLAEAALAATQQSHDEQLLAGLIERVALIKELDSAYAAAKTPLAQLAANPSDPEANLQVGRFGCFVKGDWQAGLPLLAKSSDAELAKLAALESQKDPALAVKLALGDGWWAMAQAATGIAKHRIAERAYRWYDDVSPELSGMKRVRLDARRRALEPLLLSFGALDGHQEPDKRSGPAIVKARWGGGANWADVTKRVREAVGRVETVFANPGFLKADPTPGWRKHLQITYDNAGELKSIELDEDRQWSVDEYSR